MLYGVSIASAVVVLSFSAIALKRLFAGRAHPVLPVLVLHGLVTGAPILANYLIGFPSLALFPRFVLARSDPPTQMAFAGYMVFTSVVLWSLCGQKRSADPLRGDITEGGRTVELSAGVRNLMQYAALVGMSAPVIGVIMAPHPAMYLDYGTVALTSNLTPDVTGYHQFLALLCTLAVLSGALWLLVTPRITATALLFVAPFMATSIWLHGKRTLLVLAVVCVGAALWQRGYVKGGQAVATAVLSALAIIGFSVYYQGAVRGPTTTANISPYENIRIDYGRDHQIEMAIFAYLHPDEMKILEHPGQTIFYYATLPIPRSLWPDKPFTYAQYFTGALFDTDPGALGWGMTTSWLGESVSNLGLLGFVAGPLLLAWICRLGAKRGPLTRLVTSIFACLLLMLEVTAFLPIAILWTAIVVWDRPRPIAAAPLELVHRVRLGNS